MKLPILLILTLMFLSTLISCGAQNDKKKIPMDPVVILKTRIENKEKGQLEKRRTIQEQEYAADSLRLDQVLKGALKIANQHFLKDKFIKKYEVTTESNPVSVEIHLDYHFTKTNPHLIIKRNDSKTIYIDIYTKGENKFEKVVSHQQWAMTYVNDTIQDINGDGLNDFVVNWYGATGCCLKAFSNVYLLRQGNKGFSENFEFINPTFSPKEKIIRGVCYGHPGETSIYKYKWNGEKLDTLEYVSYEINDKGKKTGKILISNTEPFGDKYKILKRLIKVPNEYTKIEGYDWFTGRL